VIEEFFPVVGIGASAGGLEAFTKLLKHLPNDTGMAFVLVQHLDPTHASALTEILSRTTAMPAPAWGWPVCMGSSSDMAAKSGFAARSARDRPLPFACPPLRASQPSSPWRRSRS